MDRIRLSEKTPDYTYETSEINQFCCSKKNLRQTLILLAEYARYWAQNPGLCLPEITEFSGDSNVWVTEEDGDTHGKKVIVMKSEDGNTFDILVDEDSEDEKLIGMDIAYKLFLDRLYVKVKTQLDQQQQTNNVKLSLSEYQLSYALLQWLTLNYRNRLYEKNEQLREVVSLEALYSF